VPKTQKVENFAVLLLTHHMLTGSWQLFSSYPSLELNKKLPR
jgi:hypothetical protein